MTELEDAVRQERRRPAQKGDALPAATGRASAGSKAKTDKMKDTALPNVQPHLIATQAPDEIRSLPGWVVWRHEGGGEGVKPRKVPYYAAGGRRHGVQGRPEDRAQLVTFDAACAAAARRGMDGVGLCLLSEFGIVVLDFDKAVTGQGLHPELAGMLGDTYVEFSPSGTGVHAIYRGNLGDRKSHADDERFGVEAFSSKGFVTFTGNALPHVADLELAGPVVAPINEAVRTLCAVRFGRQVDVDDYDPLMTYSPPMGLAESQILEALAVLDPAMGHDDWLHVGMAIHHETDGERFDLWDDWSSLAEAEYPGREELSKRWESFGKAGGVKVTARTLVKMANEHGAGISVAAVATVDDFDDVRGDVAALPFTAFDVCDLRALRANRQLSAEAPPAWWWSGYMPPGQVTLLGGHGGAGKSTLGLLLAAAATLGQPCLGQPTRPARVVFYSGEDPADVVEERLERITASMGWDFDAVAERLLVLDATVKDPALFREQRDRASFSMRALPTATFSELRRFVELHDADLLVIDNASDAFDGDENARAQVRTFIRGLASLVRPRGGAVLLFAHVDKLAARLKGNAGDNYSGSTAWHNSVRSRLFLMDTTDEKRRRPGDPTTLDLSHEKCNLGPRQPTVRLVWARNEAPKLAGATAVDAEARRDEDDMLTLVRLVSEVIERGGWVPTADQGAKTANTVLKAERGCPSGRSSAEIHRLLRDAERAGLLEGVTFEDKAQRKHRMGWRVTEAGAQRLAAPNGAL